jgi:hypothetical protein
MAGAKFAPRLISRNISRDESRVSIPSMSRLLAGLSTVRKPQSWSGQRAVVSIDPGATTNPVLPARFGADIVPTQTPISGRHLLVDKKFIMPPHQANSDAQPWLRKSGCYVDSGHRSPLGRTNDLFKFAEPALYVPATYPAQAVKH